MRKARSVAELNKIPINEAPLFEYDYLGHVITIYDSTETLDDFLLHIDDDPIMTGPSLGAIRTVAENLLDPENKEAFENARQKGFNKCVLCGNRCVTRMCPNHIENRNRI